MIPHSPSPAITALVIIISTNAGISLQHSGITESHIHTLGNHIKEVRLNTTQTNADFLIDYYPKFRSLR